jgi:hypothetical protein
MTPKQFLLEECHNIELALSELLRREYLAGGAADFHRELTQRLETIRRMVAPIAASDPDSVSLFCAELSRLSELVHRIERSHAGEFSWPFAEELRSLAHPLCREDLRTPGQEPIIRILAEGGLTSYRIHLEDDLSRIPFDRRIFTIVFPRTLKHHVLSHAIFGHEIGHAAWSIPQLRSRLRGEVLQPLCSTGPLSSVTNASYWLTGPNSPAEIKEVIAQCGWTASDLDATILDSWREELLCDLFGLVTFGPSFLAAHRALLSTLDPHGYWFGEYHPPYVSRRAMLRRACEHLGWPAHPGIDDLPLRHVLDQFWSAQIGDIALGSWQDAISAAQIETALKGLHNILREVERALFEYPASATIKHALDMLERDIPPCGADLSGAEKPQLQRVDFRTTLFAGWARWHSLTSTPGVVLEERTFSNLNHLCERGILQQRAIDLYRSRKATAA